MSEKQIVTLKDENDKEIAVEIIASFELEMNHKQYMVYSMNEEDEDGNVEILVSEMVNVTEDSFELEGVDDEEVMNEIDKVLVNILDDCNTVGRVVEV